MNGKKYTVISTFAGAGGSTLGYKYAGYKELLAIDFDKHAARCFKLNFPDISIWQRDIKTVKSDEILSECNINQGDLDILDGSPPCQGFSTSGKRQVSDPRNDLFQHFVRLTRELSPKVFIMENVSGLIKGSMKGKYNEIMNLLSKLPYKIKCKLMNSMYYNVPQSRERLIFIGIRNNLNIIPSFPIPNKKIITVQEALKDVQDGIYYKITKGKTSFILFKIRQGETGAKYHLRRSYFSKRRLDLGKPSCTITKNAGRDILHPTLDRFITDKEVARLCSFPDDFILVGSAIQRISRMGNAVMPKFMQAIAENVKINILDKVA